VVKAAPPRKSPAVVSTFRGWRERTKENHHNSCHQCGALRKHPGVECKVIAARLLWSAANQYDRRDPWAWPPYELYERWWEHDKSAGVAISREVRTGR